ncbi:hypothetical protein B566_EDAN016506 [Ephemera danica]|nr:hypothetical protein B566_EDAN016506 [Ephemera danica]
MGTRQEISLLNFYVFNSCYGPKEGEEEKKILYFYPSKTDLDTRIKTVGLSEALIKFTQTFDPDRPCESLHTQKTRQLYHQPEPGFWVVLTVSVPCLVKVRDGQEHIEYQSDDVQDAVYLAVLRQCHALYQLFNGPLTVKAANPAQIKVSLDQFYSNHADLLDVFAGMQFLPLEALTFLHAQCLINRLEAAFPTVRHSALLFNDQLVWYRSGLEPNDMQLLFSFLVTSLLPAFLETELQCEPSRPSPAPLSGRYVTGPQAAVRDGLGGQLPRVFLQNNENLFLVVYRVMSATLCLLLDGYSPPSMEFYRRLEVFLSPRLCALAEELAASCARTQTTSAVAVSMSLLPGSAPESPRYIYFNQLNRATKSTVHLDSRRCGNIAVSPELLRLLADTHSDRERLGNCSEIILKTRNDQWVSGKFSNLREFYAVLNQKSAANLIEANVKHVLPNSSSMAIITSTWSSESNPKSFKKWESMLSCKEHAIIGVILSYSFRTRSTLSRISSSVSGSLELYQRLGCRARLSLHYVCTHFCCKLTNAVRGRDARRRHVLIAKAPRTPCTSAAIFQSARSLQPTMQYAGTVTTVMSVKRSAYDSYDLRPTQKWKKPTKNQQT